MIGHNKKELPCEECGGQCCVYAPIDIKTFHKIKHKIGADAIIKHLWPGTKKEAFLVMKDEHGTCYFLVRGHCSIYTYRPKSCCGVGVDMPCAYVDPDGAAEAIERLTPNGHVFQNGFRVN
jgi:hypothetical protein